MARDASLSDVLPAHTVPFALRTALLRHVPAREPHQQHGSADKPHNAGAQLSPALHSRVGHHDGLCHALPDICLRCDGNHIASHTTRLATSGTHVTAHVTVVPLSGSCRPRHRHIHRSGVGRRVLGALLELGPQGGMGSHNPHGVCHSRARRQSAVAAQSYALSHIHHSGIPVHHHDLLRSELFSGRHAQLRMMTAAVSAHALTENPDLI